MYEVERSFIREILSVASSPEILSLAGGLPRPDLFPVDDIRSAADRVFSRHGASILQYAETSGDVDLRCWIAEHLSSEHGIPTTTDEVMITSGSQQGLDLCAKLFSDRPVAFEDPGYLGARLAFQASRTSLIPIPQNADGPDVPALEDAFGADAAVYYGMSRHQNPTGRSYTSAAADEIAELLNESDRWMIEDDPYGEIGFGDIEPSLIARRVPDRMIYLGSFSKSVAPSLRLGFIRANRSVLERLEPLKQATDLHTSTFTQGILRELLTHGKFSFADHIARICQAYRVQRDILIQEIQRHLPESQIPWIAEGGMFLWVTLPVPTDELFGPAIKRGVAFVPGRHFYLGRPDASTMRLNFSNASQDQIPDAVARLATAFRDVYGA